MKVRITLSFFIISLFSFGALAQTSITKLYRANGDVDTLCKTKKNINYEGFKQQTTFSYKGEDGVCGDIPTEDVQCTQVRQSQVKRVYRVSEGCFEYKNKAVNIKIKSGDFIAAHIKTYDIVENEFC